MIDSVLTKIALWIQNKIIPSFHVLFNDIKNLQISTSMTPEEIQLAAIKIALEALLIICLLKIGSRTRHKKHKQKDIPQKSTSSFQPKIWSPTGWYWDDKKGKWVAPDYTTKK